MLYFQIAAAIVSILLGLTQITKEGAPIVNSVIQKRNDGLSQKQTQKIADAIAGMNLQWVYRYNDGIWRYYSDPSATYWCRVNIEGIQEYAQNPATQIAANISNRY